MIPTITSLTEAQTSASTAQTGASDGICLTSAVHPTTIKPINLSELIAQLGQLYLTAGDVPVYMAPGNRSILAITKAITSTSENFVVLK